MQARIIIAVICTLLFACFTRPLLAGDDNDIGKKVREPVKESVEIRKQTQKENEKWLEEKKELVARYEHLQAENERLAKKENELEKTVSAAKKRVDGKEKQLDDIRQVTSGIMPFIEETIQHIEKLVDEDMPFLPDERQNRIQGLQQIKDDPDVEISEKFRKVMEALLVEAEYGNTIEVYQKTIEVSGRTMLANIFRLGRVSLFYQSPDQQNSGYFDIGAAQWKELPKKYNRPISSAIDIGAKRRPVELLTLPLGRMVVK